MDDVVISSIDEAQYAYSLLRHCGLLQPGTAVSDLVGRNVWDLADWDRYGFSGYRVLYVLVTRIYVHRAANAAS